MPHPLTAPRPALDSIRPPRVAVIGAGVAGSACAAGLVQAGFDVTVFDKSRGTGGRMATRRTTWVGADGAPHASSFDHGCTQFIATRPRFRAVVDRAVAAGSLARWRQRLHAPFPAPRLRDVVVATPGMPAFARHLLAGVPLRLGRAVTGLRRDAHGWHVRLAPGGPDDAAGAQADDPFDQIVVAIPAAQAAPLLVGHHDDWAAALVGVRMTPCWTLMAVTDDLDWPWDTAEPDRGVFDAIVRDDRKPGRSPDPAGSSDDVAARWVAHATPAWSLAHVEDDPADVAETLRNALGRLLTSGAAPRWRHTSVHRWRFARRVGPAAGGPEGWWDADRAIGVCGDAFGDGSVEAAWTSGDELADAMAVSFEVRCDTVAVSPRRKPARPAPTHARTELADPVH